MLQPIRVTLVDVTREGLSLLIGSSSRGFMNNGNNRLSFRIGVGKTAPSAIGICITWK